MLLGCVDGQLDGKTLGSSKDELEFDREQYIVNICESDINMERVNIAGLLVLISF